MSYNVTHTKVKEIEDFRIPISMLTQAEVEFDPEAVMYCFSFGECSNIYGKKEDAVLIVDKLEWYSEFSGTAYRESLLPAFKQSTGIFEAVFIWEGGYEIERVIVVDGEVKEEQIDL